MLAGVSDKTKSKQSETEILTAVAARSAGGAEETRRWFKSLEFVVESILRQQGSEQAGFFVESLTDRLRDAGIKVAGPTKTPYVNTIPVAEEPAYPGDWRIETRIKSFIRWNAMAMVVNANRKHDGLGGHISTYASSAASTRNIFITSVRNLPKAAGFPRIRIRT